MASAPMQARIVRLAIVDVQLTICSLITTPAGAGVASQEIQTSGTIQARLEAFT